MSKIPCGPHTDLASNDAAKITRCPCGTIHLTLFASGVTVRMSSEAMRNATIAMKAAAERIEAPSLVVPTGPTSIN